MRACFYTSNLWKLFRWRQPASVWQPNMPEQGLKTFKMFCFPSEHVWACVLHVYIEVKMILTYFPLTDFRFILLPWLFSGTSGLHDIRQRNKKRKRDWIRRKYIMYYISHRFQCTYSIQSKALCDSKHTPFVYKVLACIIKTFQISFSTDTSLAPRVNCLRQSNINGSQHCTLKH